MSEPMPQYGLAPRAARDIGAILGWTQEHFGERGRIRYEALLTRAILDVATDPKRAGSHASPEIAAAARTYHLRLSRDHVDPAIGKVRHPRHFLLYRIRSDGRVEIGRVLHDTMELKRHLPDEYR
jgi:toxin ParE1/3/4